MNLFSSNVSLLKIEAMKYLILFMLFSFVQANLYCQTWQVGTNTTKTYAITDYSEGYVPFPVYYTDGHIQYIFTVSELTSNGNTGGAMTAGMIHQIAMNFKTIGVVVPQNVNIKMGHTNTTDIIAIESVSTVVFSASTLNITLGWNNWVLSTPFNWNGTQNIIVDICFDNSAVQSTNSNFIAEYSSWGSAAKRAYGVMKDGGSGCSMTNSTGGTATQSSSVKNRPNFQFTRFTCSGTPNPGNTISSVSNPNSGQSFDLSMQNTLSGTGLFYNWMASADSINYSSLATTTTPTYTTSSTQNTYYKTEVTCKASNLNSTSNKLKITIAPTATPVELIDFYLQCISTSQLDLYWSTASEKNCDYFMIESSKDLFDWKSKKEIKGSGNSNQLINYHVKNVPYDRDDQYFRLSQIDFDGTINNYKVISVQCDFPTSEIRVTPNPTTNYLTITSDKFSLSKVVHVNIYSIDGKLLFNETFNNCTSNMIYLNALNLHPGLYRLMVEVDGNVTNQSNILVE